METLKRTAPNRCQALRAAVALAAAVSTSCASSAPTQLTDRAARIVRVAEYNLPLWLSDHEILLVHLRQPMIVVQDIATGRQRRLRALERLVRTSPVQQIAPDGRRLLWLEYDAARRRGDELNYFIHTANLDGTHHRRWRQSHPNSLLFWMSDSRRFAEIANLSDHETHYSHVLIRDALRSAPARRLLLRAPARFYIGTVMAVSSSDRLLASNAWKGVAPIVERADVYDVPLLPVTAAPRRFSVRLPPDSHLWAFSDQPGIAFSRRNGHVAWLMKNANSQNAPFALWVSKRDGSDMRLAGRQNVPTTSSQQQVWQDMEGLQWSPDGKRLGFVYRDEFRVMPAP